MGIWQEYAVEPGLFTDFKQARYLLSGFGVTKGRLIGGFPRKWEKAVRSAMSELPEMQRHAIVERLIQLKEAIVARNFAYDGARAWREQVVTCDQADPFHAIIFAALSNHPKYIDGQGDFSLQPLWQVPTRYAIPRNATALADTLKVLICRSSTIVIIDREFMPSGGTSKKWWNPIKALSHAAASSGRDISFAVHCLDKPTDRWPSGKFVRDVRNDISPLLRAATPLKANLWRQRQGGIQFHERLIITDAGGLLIDPGIDEGKVGEEYHLRLIDKAEADQHLANYTAGTGAFDLVEGVEVIGTGA